MEPTINSTQDDQQKPVTPMSDNPSNKSRRSWVWVGLAALPIVVIGTTLAMWLHFGASTKSDQKAVASVVDAQNDAIAIKLATAGPTPAAITVKIGQSVTWENTDSRQHRLTADQTLLPGFDSGDPLANGDTYTFIFETAGTFHYYDPADPTGFNGTVTVQ